MRRAQHHRIIRGWAKLLPVLVAYQAVGCLPDDAFRTVLGENMLLTSAIVIQTITGQLFNSLFGVI